MHRQRVRCMSQSPRVLTLRDAVRKMTTLPAQILRDHGYFQLSACIAT